MERDNRISVALLLAQAKGKAAKDSKKEKDRELRPWRVLRSSWSAFIEESYGFPAAAWTAVDSSLARKLIEEFGLDTSTKMVERFVEWWSSKKDGVPSMRYLYVARQTFLSVANGTSKMDAVQQELDAQEFNAEDAEKHPLIGW